MTDLFASGAAWFSTTLKNHAARSITINDRATNPSVAVTLAASSGASEWEEDAGEAAIHAYDTRDWLVAATDLVDAFDQLLKPKRGWVITDSLDGGRYEVYAPPGVRPWRFSDRNNTRIRIHSRSLDRE